MPQIPAFDSETRAIESPHVVILGAGASRAACPDGDRNGRKLPVMADLVEVLGLSGLFEAEHLDKFGGNFEQVYDGLARSPEHAAVRREIESRIRKYFAALEIPDSPTVYDTLLLSLRDKDLIATFNWDPLLPQAYMRNCQVAPLPRIAFLHGNVLLGFCAEDRVQGWLPQKCAKCGRPFAPTNLLFPVGQKDYNSTPQLASEWGGLSHYLEQAYFLTIFGYSAPTSDAAAIDLLRGPWSANATRDLAQIEIVDLKTSDEVHATWDSFIVRGHYTTSRSFNRSYLAWHPRRSCEALFAATLMCKPWPDDWMPALTTLGELHGWIAPLITEERTRKPFSPSVRAV